MADKAHEETNSALDKLAASQKRFKNPTSKNIGVKMSEATNLAEEHELRKKALAHVQTQIGRAQSQLDSAHDTVIEKANDEGDMDDDSYKAMLLKKKVEYLRDVYSHIESGKTPEFYGSKTFK